MKQFPLEGCNTRELPTMGAPAQDLQGTSSANIPAKMGDAAPRSRAIESPWLLRKRKSVFFQVP